MVKYKFTNCTLVISSALLLLLITESTSFRLPKNTVPKLYQLKLDPHIDDEKLTFDGSSSIVFEVKHPTDTVTVHSSDLIDIDQEYTKIVCNNGTIRRPISQEWNADFEFFNVKFEHTLHIGEYTIEFEWGGRVDEPPRKEGFFQRKENVNGTLENMIATNFEPRGARTVFPCWDEPSFKAEFSVAVQHKVDYKAISNMPVKEEVPIDDEDIWTIFEKTPLMSTYQLTIVVGLLEGMSNEYKNMTHWIQPGKLDHLVFSAELSPLIVAALENYTGIPYPLPKLDSVYVYSYTSEAIEHWGAITYSSKYLHEPGMQRTSNDFKIAMTIAHEISHQWFGNLVTHKWWNDIWLTESFATYFSYKILENISSRWQAKDRFAIDVKNTRSFKAKAYNTFNHPIAFIPEKLKGPEEKFQTTVYDTGAAVVQMLEHILSDDIFQNGIRKYLNKHKFGSVTTDDLWESLQEAHDESQPISHLNIKEIMDPWLHQDGHPLLNVTRNYETGVVTITQSNAAYSNSSARWKIPITFATASQPNFDNTQITHWMDPTTNSLEIHGVDKDDWIILNIQSKDFYQVVYDFENWKRIAAYLNSENYNKIHMLNRAQLLYDIPEFNESNEQLVQITVDIISYLAREVLPFPLKVGIDRVKSYTKNYRRTPVFGIYKQFALHHLKKVIDRIGYEVRQDDDDFTRLLRFKLLVVICELGDEKCLSGARAKFSQYVDDGAPQLKWNEYETIYTGDENEWMYCYGLGAANETIWDLVQPRVEIADFLRCTNNTTLITNILMKILDGRISSFYDILLYAMKSITSGPEDNLDFAIDFYIGHLDQIRQLYETKKSKKTDQKIAQTLNNFALNVRTSRQGRKLLDFLNGKGANVKGLRTSVIKLSERLRSNARSKNLVHSALRKGIESS